MAHFIGQTSPVSASKEAGDRQPQAMDKKGDCFLFGDIEGMARFVDEAVEVYVRGEPRFGALNGLASERKQSAQLVCQEYNRYGLDLFERIKGHFTIIIRDRGNDRVLVAMDKLATYPVYYTRSDAAGYLFSDSLTALVKHPLVKAKLNNQAIYNYTYFHMIPSPGTIYEDIYRVDAASYLLWQQGSVKTVKY